MRDVVLAHGLWVPGIVMLPLAARLAHAGFRCRNFTYFGAARPIAEHAARLARLAREIGPAHYVGHSLGGLVILEALNALPDIDIGRAVLLGTPARGCYAARRFASFPGGRWMLGKSEPQWQEASAWRWERPEELGVIAGSLPLGLGRLFGALPGVNDGVVTVEESAVEGMSEQLVLPVGHSAMLVSSRVADAVAAFLEGGHFGAAGR